MTETSYFWDGLVTGDAVLSPYTSDLWHTLWQTLFSRGVNEGVLNGIDNELVVSGVAGGVSVATGKAIVDGTLYESSSVISVTIPTPVTNPRIDRIVVRKDWSAKTIRIALLSGTEAASPTAPTLTQTAGGVWEIPLAQALITTAGVITVTDEIENARTRLAPAGTGGISMIETFTSTGTESSADFINIPSTFQHLELHGNILSSVAGVDPGHIQFNGDFAAANYNRIAFGRSAGSVGSGANAMALPRIDVIGFEALNSFYNTQIDMRVANYKDTTFYKIALQKEIKNPTDTAVDQNNSIENFIWKNTDAINRITISTASGVFEVGTVLTLFGVD